MATGREFKLGSELLTFKEVMDRYNKNLPVLVQVLQGHYGETNIDTFSKGHTMYLHSCCKQRRVVAKDENDRYFSFPLDYPIKCRTIKKKAGKEQTLKEIVGKTTLPVRIELCLPPAGYSLHIGQSIKQTESFGVLHLQQTYDESYFLANSVTEKGLDENILIVPSYHKDILVAMVTGFIGNDMRFFSQFRYNLETIAAGLDYDRVTGNTDIAAYSRESLSRDSENIYEYIEPSHYIKFKQIPASRKPKTLGKALKKNQPKSLADLVVESETNVYSDPVEERPRTSREYSQPPPVPVKSWLVPNTTQIDKRLSASCNPYVNDVGRAVVAPIPQTPPRKSTDNLPPIPKQKPLGHRSEKTNRFVDGYTIEQLIRCLQPLRLEKYGEKFRNGQINGNILLELDEQTLKSDFNMKGYEAIKLIKFARSGHIPT